MPRPKVDRVARSVRLPASVDAALVVEAGALGLSVNEAIESAVMAWVSDNDEGDDSMSVILAAVGRVKDGTLKPRPRGEIRYPTPVACVHPKEQRRVFGWGTLCDQCGTKIR